MYKIAIAVILFVFSVSLEVSGQIDTRDVMSALKDPVVQRALSAINTELLRSERFLTDLAGCAGSAATKYVEESGRTAPPSSTGKAAPSPFAQAAINGSVCMMKAVGKKVFGSTKV